MVWQNNQANSHQDIFKPFNLSLHELSDIRNSQNFISLNYAAASPDSHTKK